MKIALTAGFGRSPHAEIAAELARRAGHEVVGLLVASPFRLRRLRQLARSGGAQALERALRQLTGRAALPPERDALAQLAREERIELVGLQAWARAHGACYAPVPELNADASLSWLRRWEPQAVLYTGGGILRAAFLDACGGRVLNAHAGPLPQVRGMHACEWALLLGLEPCVTIHRIDRGIDTGPVLRRWPVELRAGDDIEALRARCTAVGVRGLVHALAEPLEREVAPQPARAELTRQCYRLAPALRELLEQRLRARAELELAAAG